MPTPTMPDEDLDSLFRRVAQTYPNASQLGAWERLESRLDAATAAQQLRWKVARVFAVEVAVLLLLTWQGYLWVQRPALPVTRSSYAAQPAALTPARPVGSTGTTNPPSPATRAAGRAAYPFAPSGLGLVATAPTPAGPLGSATPAGSLIPTTSTSTKASKLQGKTVIKSALTSRPLPYRLAPAVGRRKAYWQREPATETVASNRKKLNKWALPSAIASRVSAVTSSEGGVMDYDLFALTEPRQLSTASHLLPDSLARLAPPPPLADSTTAAKQPAPRPVYRLVLGVLGAPSLSAVRTPQSAQIGGDYGLTLEYRLTNRLRVRAGVVSSRKRYRAASTDYQAPASWQWFPGDYLLDANCRITEIPLDLRYDVLSRPGYTVFTSLGINSLLMRNERYSYDWTMNGQTFTKAAQVLDGSNHFLSVVNLSVGIERPLGGRWSAQVEPFWQVPLAGVGAGKVRLTSAGAAFSLKFGLVR